MPPAANCAADTTRTLKVEASGALHRLIFEGLGLGSPSSLRPAFGALGPPPIPLGLYAFIAITGARGSDLGPHPPGLGLRRPVVSPCRSLGQWGVKWPGIASGQSLRAWGNTGSSPSPLRPYAPMPLLPYCPHCLIAPMPHCPVGARGSFGWLDCGAPSRAQRNDHRRAQEMGRDDETRGRPNDSALSQSVLRLQRSRGRGGRPRPRRCHLRDIERR